MLANRLSVLMQRGLINHQWNCSTARVDLNLILTCNIVRSCRSLCLHASCNCSFINRKLLINNVHMNSTNRSSLACIEKLKVCHSDSSTTSSVNNYLQDDELESLIKSQWTVMCNEEFLKNFELLSLFGMKNHDSMSHLRYEKILLSLTDKIAHVNDEELQHLLTYIEQWYSKSKDLVIPRHLANAIDATCIERLKKLSTEEILSINQYIHKLNFIKISKFFPQSLSTLNFNDMTSSQLIQFAELASQLKTLDINFDCFERNLTKCVNGVTVDELAVIALMFFKHETPIKSDDLLMKIIEALMLNLDIISDKSLSSMLKALRYSNNLRLLGDFQVLIESLYDQIDHRNIKTLTHIALVLTTMVIEDKTLLLKIVDKFRKEIHEARIKDIERIMLTLYMMAYGPETTDFYSVAAEQILVSTRKEELESFPHSFVYTINYMMQMDFYPEEALEYIMSPDFYKRAYDTYNLDREYMMLDYCIEIDHPEYHGPRLPKCSLNALIKEFGALSNQLQPIGDFTKVDQGTRLMIDLVRVCKQVTKAESAVHTDFLLPYIEKKMVVLCYDLRTREFTSPSEHLSRLPDGTIKYAPSDDKRWFALVIGSHNLMIRNTQRPTGALAVRMRHLRRIGYVPILIPHNIWFSLKTLEGKRNYVKSLLV